MNYSWAINKIKLQRAIAQSVTKDEADVKEIYKKMGGLVEGEASVETVKTPKEEIIATFEEDGEQFAITHDIGTEETVSVKPAKRTRKNAK